MSILPTSGATPHVYWLTGLPASGKTTLARALQQRLQGLGHQTALLDGDELRRGLCADLGLDDRSRTENIRRAGEVARLMCDAGLSVVCAFVSPFAADRQRVRELFAPANFSEVYVATELAVCMQRDPKGLYGRAQRGEISGLTGWDAPFEAPAAPEFCVDTSQMAMPAMLDLLQARLGSPSPRQEPSAATGQAV